MCQELVSMIDILKSRIPAEFRHCKNAWGCDVVNVHANKSIINIILFPLYPPDISMLIEELSGKMIVYRISDPGFDLEVLINDVIAAINTQTSLVVELRP